MGPTTDQTRRRQRYRNVRTARLILPPEPPVPVDTGPAPMPGFHRMTFSGFTVGAHIAPTSSVEEAHLELSHPLFELPVPFEVPGYRDPGGRGIASFEESSLAHETPNPAVEGELTFDLPNLDDHTWDDEFFPFGFP